MFKVFLLAGAGAGMGAISSAEGADAGLGLDGVLPVV